MAKARTAPDRDSLTRYRNYLDHPVEVVVGDTGQFIESGGFIDLEDDDVKVPHNKSMIDDGALKKV